MEFLATVPEWLRSTVAVLGTIGGIALTYALGKLGMGYGKERAKEEAVAQAIAAPPAGGGLSPQLVGIGGALMGRADAEAINKIGTGLVIAVERLAAIAERIAERMEDDAEKKALLAEFEKDAAFKRLRDELETMKKEQGRV